MKTVKLIIIGLFSFILGVIFTRYVITERCYERIEMYQQLLNDPHHCISVLVEALEQDYE